jgi:hypothetical protein
MKNCPPYLRHPAAVWRQDAANTVCSHLPLAFRPHDILIQSRSEWKQGGNHGTGQSVARSGGLVNPHGPATADFQLATVATVETPKLFFPRR